MILIANSQIFLKRLDVFPTESFFLFILSTEQENCGSILAELITPHLNSYSISLAAKIKSIDCI